LERLVQEPRVGAAQQLRLGTGTAGLDRVDFLIERLRDLLPALLLVQPGVERAADNGEQPGPRVGTLEAVEELHGAQAGGLPDLFRVLIVAGEPAGQVVRRVQMRQDRPLAAAAAVVLPEKKVANPCQHSRRGSAGRKARLRATLAQAGAAVH